MDGQQERYIIPCTAPNAALTDAVQGYPSMRKTNFGGSVERDVRFLETRIEQGSYISLYDEGLRASGNDDKVKRPLR